MLIDAGQARIVLAGGAESFSLRPLRAHTFADGREPEFYTRLPFSLFPDSDPDMADAADVLAHDYGISREEQDAFAVESYARALAARARLAGEIVPLAGIDHDMFTRALKLKLAARTPIVSGSVMSRRRRSRRMRPRSVSWSATMSFALTLNGGRRRLFSARMRAGRALCRELHLSGPSNGFWRGRGSARMRVGLGTDGGLCGAGHGLPARGRSFHGKD
ncbi:hypothetical protein [Breoghania sp.]|uniref:thiolase family protein n=1 Tax=Breoghania sp. TaxID=2065378 RepID=UPI0026192CF8|nr:hypothetical protein [Breoghania sp.]MDJ0931238.1 hypothetical protein [Breoghania sp.]